MPGSFRKIGVIGCGKMGQGIVLSCVQNGYHVVFKEADFSLQKISHAALLGQMESAVKKERATIDQHCQWTRMIRGTTYFSDLSQCDLIIEAVSENIDLKKETLSNLKDICPQTIITSNTSSLAISDLVRSVEHRGHFAGLHFFWPAHVNKLVEVVSGEKTSKATIAKLIGFVKSLGKTPILVKDLPGFAVNRYFVPWLNEATKIVQGGGANIATVDWAAKEIFGVKIGPFELMNLTCIPIAYHSAVSLGKKLGAFYAPSQLLENQYQAGKLWLLDGEIRQEDFDEISSRLIDIVFMICSKMLMEGVATSNDIDTGAVIGLGWRKGPFALVREKEARE